MNISVNNRKRRSCNENIVNCFACHSMVQVNLNLNIKCLNTPCKQIKHIFCARKLYCTKQCKVEHEQKNKANHIISLLEGEEEEKSTEMESSKSISLNIGESIQCVFQNMKSSILSTFSIDNGNNTYANNDVPKCDTFCDANAMGPIYQSSHGVGKRVCIDARATYTSTSNDNILVNSNINFQGQIIPSVDSNSNAKNSYIDNYQSSHGFGKRACIDIQTAYTSKLNDNILLNSNIGFQGQKNASAGSSNDTKKSYIGNYDFELIDSMAKQIDELNDSVSFLQNESGYLRDENTFLKNKMIELNNHVAIIVTHMNDSLCLASNEFKNINENMEMNAKIEKKLEHNISAMNSQIHVLTSYVLRNCRKINEVRYDLLKSNEEIKTDEIDEEIRFFFSDDDENQIYKTTKEEKDEIRNNNITEVLKENKDKEREITNNQKPIIYIGRLPHNFNEQALYKLIQLHFGAYGKINNLFLNNNRHFAFVEYVNKYDASIAVNKMNGFVINNRQIKCEYSRLQLIPKKDHSNNSNNLCNFQTNKRNTNHNNGQKHQIDTNRLNREPNHQNHSQVPLNNVKRGNHQHFQNHHGVHVNEINQGNRQNHHNQYRVPVNITKRRFQSNANDTTFPQSSQNYQHQVPVNNTKRRFQSNTNESSFQLNAQNYYHNQYRVPANNTKRRFQSNANESSFQQNSQNFYHNQYRVPANNTKRRFQSNYQNYQDHGNQHNSQKNYQAPINRNYQQNHENQYKKSNFAASNLSNKNHLHQPNFYENQYPKFRHKNNYPNRNLTINYKNDFNVKGESKLNRKSKINNHSMNVNQMNINQRNQYQSNFRPDRELNFHQTQQERYKMNQYQHQFNVYPDLKHHNHQMHYMKMNRI
jgi:hypothetical protein